MSLQIEKKWLGEEAVDGSKIKILTGQALIAEGQSGSIDLIKLNESGDAVVPQGVIASEGFVASEIASEAALRESGDTATLASAESYTDAEILSEKGLREAEDLLMFKKDGSRAMTGNVDMGSYKIGSLANGTELGEAINKGQLDALELDIEGQMSALQENLEAVDVVLQGNIDAEELARETADSALSSRVAVLEADPVTKSYVDAADLALDGKISTEKGRIDAILLASDADKDSFAEIVSLINSVDTTNDQAFAGYVLSNDARSAEIESDISDLDSRLTIVEETKEIVEVESIGEAPAIGLIGTVYVAKDDNKIYRWATVGGGELTFDLVVGAGEAHATLESAITAASNGQNILVKPGTYLVSSAIAVNKEVKIVGEDKDTVIFETAASTSAPVNMFNVTANNVALAKMTIKHKKTTNTSVEAAVVASGAGFPQTRITNFIMEQCNIEFCEFGLTVRAQDWCVRDSKFTYATGLASNSCRAIGIYGTKGNSFIKDNFLKNDVLNGTAFRPFYLTSTNGSNPNETVEGKLVIEGTTHVGALAQFWNQDNSQNVGVNTFELQIKNNVINESNLFAAFFSSIANAGNMFSSITLSGNTISNLHAVDGGKGLYSIAGTAAFRTSPLIVHASNNTIGQSVYRSGSVSVEGALIGKETAVPAFTVALDSIIPATGSIPTIIPAGYSEYVEISPVQDLSEIESSILSIEERLDTLEVDPTTKSYVDSEISAEALARSNGDSSTLTSANLYTDAEVLTEKTRAESAELLLSNRIDILEGKAIEEDIMFEVGVAGVGINYVELAHESQYILKATVGRLNIFKNVDYSVSVVAGKTRMTWIGELASSGASPIANGDKIFVTYMH
jgi:hypothetical protein